jgi:leucyl-tRNA synthetase
MLSLKESYLIAKKNQPNPFVLLQFIETFLILMNPITPHFCQNIW